MSTRLYRSRSDAMLGGVCSGLGQYLGIDPSFVRVFFVLFTVMGGFGVPLYLVLWIVLPRQPESPDEEEQPDPGDESWGSRARGMGEDLRTAFDRPNLNAARLIGIGLVLAGIVYLLRNFDLPWLRWLQADILWPLLLIAAGAFLLMRAVKGE